MGILILPSKNLEFTFIVERILGEKRGRQGIEKKEDFIV